MTLANLALGETGQVKALRTTGAIRRRLLDLGLVPGTVVQLVLKGPSGDPAAYLIRGAVIALRAKEARQILMEED